MPLYYKIVQFKFNIKTFFPLLCEISQLIIFK